MKNQLSFLLLFSLIFVISCKKDKMPSDDCEEIENIISIFGYTHYLLKENIYNHPHFNPNNSDEIVFTYQERRNTKSKLIKYNLVTEEYEEIFEGLIESRVRWSKKDWILFSLKEENSFITDIWKIKSSGDSLTQMTFSGYYNSGEWDISGERFTYNIGNVADAFVVSNAETLESDTFSNGILGVGSWQHPSKFIYADTDGLMLGNFDDNNLERIYTYETGNGSRKGAEWIDDKEIVWTDSDGIYLSKISRNSRKTVLATCSSRNYRSPAYSSELDKLLLIRVRLEKADSISEIAPGYEIHGETFNELVMMSLNGRDEEVIQIHE